jgi:fatty-acyl-CoA synthase
MEYTLGYLLKRSACKFPSKAAIWCEGRTITYAELNGRVNRLANSLLNLGIKKGDRVASLMYNSPDLIVAYFAAAKLGAISVPINYRLVSREIKYIVDHSESSVLIYDDDLRTLVQGGLESAKLVLISVGEKTFPDSIHLEEIITNAEASEPEGAVGENDLRFIMYTSGTTGFPKGAMFTHKNNLWAALSLIITKKYDFNEVVLFVNPLYHMNSYVNVIASMFMGNKIVIMKKFDPIKMLELIESERVTICSVVPTICQRLLELTPRREFDTKSWRYCTCTGAPWPIEMKKMFIERFPSVVMADAYGATEVFSGTLIQGEEILRKPKSVGRPYLDTIIKVVDDCKRELSAGRIGEIAFYGPHVTQGYYKNPDATNEALDNGWFYSGDLGYFDEDGYLYLADRKKDMIISGGENIYSLEIENVLMEHDKISEAAVVGVADDKWGEVVKAYIVLKPSIRMEAQEVIDYCQEYLGSYKKPRYIEFVEALPKNSLGKVLKKDLRRM